MKIVKKMFLRSVVEEGKKIEKWLPSYFLVIEGCKPICIKCVFPNEAKVLDFVAEWGGFVDVNNKQDSIKNN